MKEGNCPTSSTKKAAEGSPEGLGTDLYRLWTTPFSILLPMLDSLKQSERAEAVGWDVGQGLTDSRKRTVDKLHSTHLLAPRSSLHFNKNRNICSSTPTLEAHLGVLPVCLLCTPIGHLLTNTHYNPKASLAKVHPIPIHEGTH